MGHAKTAQRAIAGIVGDFLSVRDGNETTMGTYASIPCRCQFGVGNLCRIISAF